MNDIEKGRGKMKTEKNKIFTAIFEYLTIIVGGFLVGVSVGWVLLPEKLTTGGFGGLSTIGYHLFNIPANLSLILLNIPLYILAWKALGFKYSIRSLVGMIFSTVGISVAENMTQLTTDMMLAALYGGVFSGIGIALTYSGGGSTGGTDLVAKLVHKKRPYMNMGEILLFVDGIIITILVVAFKNIDIGLYSIVALAVMSKIVDFILDGVHFAKAVFIITDNCEKISQYIHSNIGRTATKIEAFGTYSETKKDVLLCIINKKEIPKLKDAINEIDPTAFYVVTTVTEAIGRGFKNHLS